MHELTVCMPFTLYVNPASTTILELGTKLNPFKSINLAILVSFNFLSQADDAVYVKLSKGSVHYLKHNFSALYNMTSMHFEPYNSDMKDSDADQYDSQTRTRVIYSDQEILLANPTTRFNILSSFTNDEAILESMEDAAMRLYYNDSVALPIIMSEVKFKNLRFEDDFNQLNEQNLNYIKFVAYKLGSQYLTFET